MQAARNPDALLSRTFAEANGAAQTARKEAEKAYREALRFLEGIEVHLQVDIVIPDARTPADEAYLARLNGLRGNGMVALTAARRDALVSARDTATAAARIVAPSPLTRAEFLTPFERMCERSEETSPASGSAASSSSSSPAAPSPALSPAAIAARAAVAAHAASVAASAAGGSSRSVDDMDIMVHAARQAAAAAQRANQEHVRARQVVLASHSTAGVTPALASRTIERALAEFKFARFSADHATYFASLAHCFFAEVAASNAGKSARAVRGVIDLISTVTAVVRSLSENPKLEYSGEDWMRAHAAQAAATHREALVRTQSRSVIEAGAAAVHAAYLASQAVTVIQRLITGRTTTRTEDAAAFATLHGSSVAGNRNSTFAHHPAPVRAGGDGGPSHDGGDTPGV